MSKVFALFFAFMTTLAVCFLANAGTVQPTTKTLTLDPGAPIIVAEIVATPGHILVEPEKVLMYQLRHRFTFKCGAISYGVINYHREFLNLEVILLSGQKIDIPINCVPSIGEPVKAIYVYHRVVQNE